MIVSCKFRMYESSKRHRLDNLVTTATRIWNYCVAFQKTYYRLFKKHCHKFALMKHVAKVRNRKEEWQIVGAQSVNEVIKKLDRTYQSFFKWIKKRSGLKKGTPKFKKSAGSGSVCFTQSNWAYLGSNRVRIGKHQYKFIKHREIEGKIKTCTIKRDNLNRFWVVFCCEKEDPVNQIVGSNNTAGFDFGLDTFLTCSENSTIESPQFFKRGMRDIAKCGRDLASKKKSSNNRKKAKHRLSKAHERITNRRSDWFFKLAHSLCDRFERLYFETLNLDAMKRLWGRKVSDLSFDKFLEILEWVAFKRGRKIGFVGRWEPTSKTCSKCGHVQNMPLDVRTFDCGSCGLSIGRDLNAALNIKRLGHQADGLEDARLGFGQAVLV